MNTNYTVEELEEMLAARTDGTGKPRYGYAANVAMINEALRRKRREQEIKDGE